MYRFVLEYYMFPSQVQEMLAPKDYFDLQKYCFCVFDLNFWVWVNMFLFSVLPSPRFYILSEGHSLEKGLSPHRVQTLFILFAENLSFGFQKAFFKLINFLFHCKGLNTWWSKRKSHCLTFELKSVGHFSNKQCFFWCHLVLLQGLSILCYILFHQLLVGFCFDLLRSQ